MGFNGNLEYENFNFKKQIAQSIHPHVYTVQLIPTPTPTPVHKCQGSQTRGVKIKGLAAGTGNSQDSQQLPD